MAALFSPWPVTLLPLTERGAPVMSWYGHWHGKGDHPSLLARHHRSPGHSDELSQTEHGGRAPATAIRICRDGRAAGHVQASDLSPEDGGRVALDLLEQVIDLR